MSFKSDLVQDARETFLNPEEFGEVATLVRGGNVIGEVRVLYDAPVVSAEDLGGGIDAISHSPRLYVAAADLPNGKPSKGDSFRLSATDFHAAITVVAKDFEDKKDGVVVYYCKDAR